MRCISLLQPWATCVVLGLKRYETRTWATRHRGTLAVHASRRFPPSLRALCRQDPLRRLLREAGFAGSSEFLTGVILGTVEVVDCRRVEALGLVGADELALGDFRPGRWAWVLADPRPLAAAVTYRGMQGIFDLPDPITRYLEAGGRPAPVTEPLRLFSPSPLVGEGRGAGEDEDTPTPTLPHPRGREQDP
jgi:hypothetical protein